MATTEERLLAAAEQRLLAATRTEQRLLAAAEQRLLAATAEQRLLAAFERRLFATAEQGLLAAAERRLFATAVRRLQYRDLPTREETAVVVHEFSVDVGDCGVAHHPRVSLRTNEDSHGCTARLQDPSPICVEHELHHQKLAVSTM